MGRSRNTLLACAIAAVLAAAVACRDRGAGDHLYPPADEPQGKIDSPSAAQVVTEGDALEFAASCEDATGNIPLSHHWDFGGAAPDSTEEDPGPVTFGEAGTFVIHYTCTDSEGNPDYWPESVVVTVRPFARRVDAANGSGVEDGRTWATAFTDVQAALDDAPARAEIWVAKGTYRADAPGGYVAIITKPLSVYGGFSGGETLLSERPSPPLPAILDGDQDGSGGPTGSDSDHVVYIGLNAKDVLLDGFTIRGGYMGVGAGLVVYDASEVLVRNTDIVENVTYTHGGGAVVEAADVRFEDVLFAGNEAYAGAGLVSFYNSHLEFFGTVFTGNVADVRGGGAAIESQGSASFENCAFLLNSAGDTAGALLLDDSATLGVTHSTFYGNEAGFSPLGTGDGGAIWIGEDRTFAIRNSVFAGNRNVRGAAPLVSDLFVEAGAVSSFSSVSFTCSEEDLASAVGATGWAKAQDTDIVLSDLRGFGAAAAAGPDGVQEPYLDPGSACVNLGNNTTADLLYTADNWRELTTREDGVSEWDAEFPEEPTADAGMHYLP